MKNKLIISFVTILILSIINGYFHSTGIRREGGFFFYIILSIIAGILHTLISLLILIRIEQKYLVITYNLAFVIIGFCLAYVNIPFLFAYPILFIFRVIYFIIERSSLKYNSLEILDEDMVNNKRE